MAEMAWWRRRWCWRAQRRRRVVVPPPQLQQSTAGSSCSTDKRPQSWACSEPSSKNEQFAVSARRRPPPAYCWSISQPCQVELSSPPRTSHARDAGIRSKHT